MKKFIIPLVALTTFLGCRSVQVMNTKPVRVTVENQPIAVDVKNFPPAQGQASNVIVTNPVKILSNKIPYFDILIDNNQRVAPRKPGRRLWITFASTTKYSGGAAPYQPSTANISLNTNIDKLPP
ncbi:MAG TPA: hypothetical protein VHA52_06050, partial [Candidatus Babeliaceae bacterium]|nr:hypothetical protein [Candidatus Babeliaceae bacterium]